MALVHGEMARHPAAGIDEPKIAQIAKHDEFAIRRYVRRACETNGFGSVGEHWIYQSDEKQNSRQAETESCHGCQS